MVEAASVTAVPKVCGHDEKDRNVLLAARLSEAILENGSECSRVVEVLPVY